MPTQRSDEMNEGFGYFDIYFYDGLDEFELLFTGRDREFDDVYSTLHHQHHRRRPFSVFSYLIMNARQSHQEKQTSLIRLHLRLIECREQGMLL